MSGLLWKLNRLRTMSPMEMIWRAEQAFNKHACSFGVGLARVPDTQRDISFGLAFLSNESVDLLTTDALIDKANQLLSGRWNVFALRDVELGFPPKWNIDPLTRTQAPMCLGKSIDFRRKELVGNIKYLWEPGRHLDLVTLAQAWRLTGDVRYMDGARVLLSSWLDQCPYPLGVHWASSLELAVRLTNWACAWHLLGGAESPLFGGADGELFRRRWLDSVYQHCHFIEGFFSFYSSANNHLFGEYMGLFIASVTWPCWQEAAHWTALAKKGLESEALKQNSADGVNREQAVYYQHEVMAMMLLSYLVGRANGVMFSAAFLGRLERMAEFIVAIMDTAGNVPMIGDADGAQMLRLEHDPDHDVFHSLLASCAVIFKRPDFKQVAGEFDDTNRWLFGRAGLADWDAIPEYAAANQRTFFSEGGYYVFGSAFGTDVEVKGLIDCGPIGYPSIAAHGHADALSVWLSICGEPCLIDPGTYSYWADQQWRDYFRGTSSHNTVRIDRLDQSVSGGRFMWTKKANCTVNQSPVSPEKFVFSGSHDGYTRMRDPVIHTREVRYDGDTGLLAVKDLATGFTEHCFEQYWHIAPGVEVSVTSPNSVRLTGNNFTVDMWVEGSDSPIEVFHASDNPIAGWYSRTYEQMEPCMTLKVSQRGCGLDLRTSFSIRSGPVPFTKELH
jgi:hypothetical protein